ncbi:hypothetical protein P0136_12995 [Lentisphaerota bacterium ZTH]|nr:hypothetical protein JYG24_09490 [Lentisphaerota bacterium]WET06275.1 hypothetical protein P0136_12995 [Lentisphaerota bacterium ZTH]
MKKIILSVILVLLMASAKTYAQDLRYSQVPEVFDRNALTTGGIPRGQNTSSSRPYLNTMVMARLNVDIDKNTGRVNFIRDNADPFVITKVYKLKYANPYTLRDYLLSAVEARKVADNDTFVAGIEYNNGDKFLIISAEDYRFTDTVNGVGLDTLVKTLDQPKITASSGSERYMYWPMYRSAAELKTMITNVGANTSSNPEELELQYGKDKVNVDEGLNSLFFYTPLYTIKNIRKMMRQYDVPLPEVKLTYKVYELFAENDSDIGADFLAWKNNDGADLFSTGMRYRSNWGGTFGSGLAKTGSGNTKFINFNPKWNSRYLDFLASKGKAEILTQGSILIRNRQTGNITKQSGIFNVERLDKQAGSGVKEAVYNESGSFTNGTSFDNTNVDYRLYAYKSDGTRIAMKTSNSCNLAVMEIDTGNPGTTSYMMSVKGNTFIDGNGRDYGTDVTVFGFKLQKPVTDKNGQTEWVTVDPAQTETSQRNTQFGLKPGSYGFNISITPVVNMRATVLDIDMTDVSLIGWSSDGTPRLSKDSRIKTKVHIGHNDNGFVIGGLRKREVVRSTTGLPLLSKLPVLGYLFSTESESTKRSQLVLVCKAESSYPESTVGKTVVSQVKNTEEKLKNAGDKNKYFFNQWVMDN